MAEKPTIPALVVQSPFAGYDRGDTITDPSAIAAILDSAHAVHVTRSNIDPDSLAADKPPAAA